MQETDRVLTYIGVLVVVSALSWKAAGEWLFPLALCTFVHSGLETMLAPDMAWGERAVSAVAHACVPLACFVHGYPPVTIRGVAVAACVLLAVAGVYAALRRRPYALSNAQSTLLWTSTLVVLLAHCAS